MVLTLLRRQCSTKAQTEHACTVGPYAVTVKVRGDLVNVRTHTATDQPGHIMHSFTEALKAYPKARRIRVSWDMFLGMNYRDSTALYDRRIHSVVFFGESDGDLGK